MCAMQEESVRKFYDFSSNLDYLYNVTVLFRVIQQRAGEWLLRQLNQMKDAENGNVELQKENLLNVNGE